MGMAYVLITHSSQGPSHLHLSRFQKPFLDTYENTSN